MKRDRILETLEACRDIFFIMHGPLSPAAKAVEQAVELRKEEAGLCDYIEEHAETILIREQVFGHWGDYSLWDLPARLALKHVLRFIREGVRPHRVVRTGDQAEAAGREAHRKATELPEDHE